MNWGIGLQVFTGSVFMPLIHLASQLKIRGTLFYMTLTKKSHLILHLCGLLLNKTLTNQDKRLDS